MYALLVFIEDVQPPRRTQLTLNAEARLQRIRRVVVRILKNRFRKPQILTYEVSCFLGMCHFKTLNLIHVQSSGYGMSRQCCHVAM